MNNLSKIKSYAGFEIKMGKAVFGVDLITASRRSPEVVLYDATLSENSKSKLMRYLTEHNKNGYMAAMEEIAPGRNCKALGIKDKNLATAIETAIKESKE